MPEENLPHISVADFEEADPIDLTARRQANREFMRQWRADPQHLTKERQERKQRYYSRQKQKTLRDIAFASATGLQSQSCGFCSRSAVRLIRRLQISAVAPEEYVEVLVPYCGQC
jgi:hypothetical protein